MQFVGEVPRNNHNGDIADVFLILINCIHIEKSRIMEGSIFGANNNSTDFSFMFVRFIAYISSLTIRIYNESTFSIEKR